MIPLQPSGETPPREARERAFVIVPALDEATTIAQVVSELATLYPNVVVVDDGSADATADLARQSGAEVLRHPVNRGQGAALQTGITWALRRGATAVVTFDADGQHRPQDVAPLLEALAAGVDIALGSRFLDGRPDMPAVRWLLLRSAVLFTRWTSGLPVTDTHNGLRAFSRRAAQRIDLRLDRMAHASELLDQVARSGLRWREVPVEIHYTSYSRAKGQSNWEALRIALDYLLARLLG